MRRSWRHAAVDGLGAVAAGGLLRKALVLAWIALGGVFVVRALLVSLRPDHEYYKHVDEVTANPGLWAGKRLFVHGFVAPDSIEKWINAPMYRFVLQSCSPRPRATILARYTGVVPAGLKSNAEVVVRGMLGDDGALIVSPDGIMTRCPSKYSGPPPGEAIPPFRCRTE